MNLTVLPSCSGIECFIMDLKSDVYTLHYEPEKLFFIPISLFLVLVILFIIGKLSARMHSLRKILIISFGISIILTALKFINLTFFSFIPAILIFLIVYLYLRESKRRLLLSIIATILIFLGFIVISFIWALFIYDPTAYLPWAY